MFEKHPLVQGAKLSQRTFNPLLLVLILLILLVSGELVGIPLKLLLSPLAKELPDTLFWNSLKDSFFTLILPFSGIIVVVFLYLRFIEKRPFASLGLGLSPPFGKPKAAFWRYLTGFLLGILAMTLYVVCALWIGIYDASGLTLHMDSSRLAAVLIMVPGWMIQGASEEILTRGWLFQAALRKNFALAVIMCTLLFSLMHLANDGLSLLSLVNLALYATFALTLTLYTESLFAACGFHAAWNWSQGNVFGILISGSNTRAGSLISLGATKGPHWLTGGPFGAEGSVVVTVLLLLWIGILLIGLKKKAPSWKEKSSCDLCPHSKS